MAKNKQQPTGRGALWSRFSSVEVTRFEERVEQAS